MLGEGDIRGSSMIQWEVGGSNSHLCHNHLPLLLFPEASEAVRSRILSTYRKEILIKKLHLKITINFYII